MLAEDWKIWSGENWPLINSFRRIDAEFLCVYGTGNICAVHVAGTHEDHSYANATISKGFVAVDGREYSCWVQKSDTSIGILNGRRKVSIEVWSNSKETYQTNKKRR